MYVYKLQPAHAVKISYLATLYTFTKKKKMFGNNNVRFKELQEK